MSSDFQTIPFTGQRLRFQSSNSFDQTLARLLSDVGEKPVNINEIAMRNPTWESYQQEIQSHVGVSGFILFARLDHGVWIKKAGIERNVLRLIIGNPLIAITMIRHDIVAGLFAPIELLLTDEPDGASAIVYLKPSSMMVIESNPLLLEAAIELDIKLEAMVRKAVACQSD